jgi:ethanolamine utilization protein EutP
MKKIILIGRSECGKTTLIQALNGEKIRYEKTQYVSHDKITIDTPGEYIQAKSLGAALAMYTYEADVVGLVLSADEPYSLYSPCITQLANREVIGIVTKTDVPGADAERAESWLKLAGCEKIFCVSSFSKEGIGSILEYLENA